MINILDIVVRVNKTNEQINRKQMIHFYNMPQTLLSYVFTIQSFQETELSSRILSTNN
jgi:hypothetical protein